MFDQDDYNKFYEDIFEKNCTTKNLGCYSKLPSNIYYKKVIKIERFFKNFYKTCLDLNDT